MTVTKEQPIITFETAQQWHAWLVKNHASSGGIFIRIFRKNAGKQTVSYEEALDEALCFGWIDGLKKSYDEASWIQKFTPRRPKSMWSKRNKEHIARLIKERRMSPAGLKEVEAAKQDGRWENAYDSPKNMQIPTDFLQEVKKDEKLYAFFQTLNKTNTYAIAWRLATAKKPETRERRMKKILDMLSQEKKFY